ncbi:MAG: hypothetical protein ACXAEU_25385 [Candidatus Hodarchaeales archaeon]|jgi:hypothetical protein
MVSRVLKSSQKFRKRSGLHSRDEYFVQLAAVEMLLQDYDISAKAKEVFHFILKKGGLVTKTLIENGLTLKRSNLNLYLNELDGIDLVTVFSAKNRKFQRIRSRKHSKVILVKKAPPELFKHESFQNKFKALEILETYERFFIPLSADVRGDFNLESSLYLQKWSSDLSKDVNKVISALEELEFTKEEAAILAYTFSLRTASLSTIKQSLRSLLQNMSSSDFEINFTEALRFLEKSRFLARYGKKSAAGVILISSFGMIARERIQQLLRSEELLDLSINSLLNEYFSNFQRKMVQNIPKDVHNTISDMLLRTEELVVNLHNPTYLDAVTNVLVQLSVQNKLKKVNFCISDKSMIQDVLESFLKAFKDKYELPDLDIDALKQTASNKEAKGSRNKFKLMRILNFYELNDFGLETTLIFDEQEVILLHNEQSGTYTVFYKTTEKEYQKFLKAKQQPLDWQ